MLQQKIMIYSELIMIYRNIIVTQIIANKEMKMDEKKTKKQTLLKITAHANAN